MVKFKSFCDGCQKLWSMCSVRDRIIIFFIAPVCLIAVASMVISIFGAGIDVIFSTERSILPVETRVRVEKVVTSESDIGKRTIGLVVSARPNDPYLPVELNSKGSVEKWFGEKFAETDFRYGQEFFADCPRVEKYFPLGVLKDSYRLRYPCTIRENK